MKRWFALALLGGMGLGQGYVVQPGDTLERIARLFQVPVAELMLANGLIEDPLPAGLELTIPPSEWNPMNLEVLPLPDPPQPKPPPWVFLRLPPAPKEPRARSVQEGLASWYGGRFHGRRTASGERFDKFQLTAAHRNLPFGTWVRVVNPRSGRSVVVRINDRGPHTRGRIIDLSYGAALRLGMERQGILWVRLEILDRRPQP
ncbi:MAG: septal ring lytic transglycosylase RlpA family protein [Meiothermus sp.]|uniref:septal ring lytic transglycosylase RlpA family protein n=1 Tax=Meiothermus sp. TaxID=1955249 RepID=UPI0025D29F52|nr:septal ring lytic transglycosylase RlpA family protein [Meiothermus sp.]MCS7059386.1 septal ring lytic transglycosylase RlpA family protein [Meiothermus sp.]MCS7193801.1 septal ring lytic transglycosylase RlpA family protein [Meiothermus sp.]MCX7739778.1 septal ring lytic transglycosylase RlpA family protein [Meiothermus sp.]MDW8090260.1 septal ring lytic transglycosylase RlpA family protein [Meiothermus sp.]MDW8481223.1 septal ring lytic transglycosylase RlpA family protein [Meiothermus sp